MSALGGSAPFVAAIGLRSAGVRLLSTMNAAPVVVGMDVAAAVSEQDGIVPKFVSCWLHNTLTYV